METITACAYLNRREVPNLLHIHGRAILKRTEDRVKLVIAQPCECNPTVLLMDLNIIEGTKPKKGNTKLFRKDLRGNHATGYEEVHIRYSDGEGYKVYRVPVETFGK